MPMPPFKSRAFVLNSVDYRETSKLLHLFCEKEGRISLIAKGLKAPKSRKATAAESFNLVQITYTLKEGATLGLLNGIEPERVFSSVRNRLEAYAMASYWFEIVSHASQARLASPEMFVLTESFLGTLDEERELTTMDAWHFARLLRELGFGAVFGICSNCGRTDTVELFDVRAAATICPQCAGATGRYYRVPASAAEALKQVFAQQRSFPRPLNAEEAAAFLALLGSLFSLHLDQRMRSFEFMRGIVMPGGKSPPPSRKT